MSLPQTETVETIIRDVSERAILPRFRKLERHDVSEKSPGDLVTVADTEAEWLLSESLTGILPGSTVVGEENASSDPGIFAAFDRDDPVWVVDPVDGTQNFVDGKACFATIVALVVANETLAGWIYDPINETTVWAKKGEGAWERGRRLGPLQAKQVPDMSGALGRRLRRRMQSLSENGAPGMPRAVKRYRCVGREYMDLARGVLDFCDYTGNLKPWDHAAGVLIHDEAGGFSARVETGRPYVVERTMGPGNLLLAPSDTTWQALNRLVPW